MRDPLAEERARAVELVNIALPVMCEAIAVILFIAMAAVWIIIAATPVPV